MKYEILYGIHSVMEALKAKRRRISSICVQKEKAETKRFAELLDIAHTRKILVEEVSSKKFSSLCRSEAHQGIFAKTDPYPISNIFDILKKNDESGKRLFILVLDGILDPGNMGALIRTALCSGVDCIVISKDRSAQPTPDVSRISAGAMEHIKICKVTNLVKTIEALKKAGIWVFGLDLHGKESIFQQDLSEGIAIVTGGEEKGIRPLVRKHCDHLVSIPQQGPLNSLNASVAGAVAMYEAFRQWDRKTAIRKNKKGV